MIRSIMKEQEFNQMAKGNSRNSIDVHQITKKAVNTQEQLKIKQSEPYSPTVTSTLKQNNRSLKSSLKKKSNSSMKQNPSLKSLTIVNPTQNQINQGIIASQMAQEVSSINSMISSIGSPKVQFSFDTKDIHYNQNINDQANKEDQIKNIKNKDLPLAQSKIQLFSQFIEQFNYQSQQQKFKSTANNNSSQSHVKQLFSYQQIENNPGDSIQTQSIEITKTIDQANFSKTQQETILTSHQQQTIVKARPAGSLNILSSPRTHRNSNDRSFIDEIKISNGSTTISNNIILKGLRDRNTLHNKFYRFWDKYLNEVMIWLISQGREAGIRIEYSLLLCFNSSIIILCYTNYEYSMQMIVDIIEAQTHQQAKDIIKQSLPFLIKAFYLNKDSLEPQKPRLLYLLKIVSSHYSLQFFIQEFINGYDFNENTRNMKFNQYLLECIGLALDSTNSKPDFQYLTNTIISPLLLSEINNPEAIIRKSIIECLVSVKHLLGHQEFDKVVKGRLNETQESLINIYYQRKMQIQQEKLVGKQAVGGGISDISVYSQSSGGSGYNQYGAKKINTSNVKSPNQSINHGYCDNELNNRKFNFQKIFLNKSIKNSS